MKCKDCAYFKDSYCNNIESIYYDVSKESDDGCTMGEEKDDIYINLVLDAIIIILIVVIGYLVFK